MKPRSKEFVDLILEENIEGIDGFVDQLRCCVKDKLKDVDLFELASKLNINYNKLSSYVYDDLNNMLGLQDIFKLLKFVKK
jgi:hypothetical protein